MNVEIVLITGPWWVLTTWGMNWSPALTVIAGAPLFAAVVLIDARLLGRFLYRAHEVVVLAHEDESTDDEEP